MDGASSIITTPSQIITIGKKIEYSMLSPTQQQNWQH